MDSQAVNSLSSDRLPNRLDALYYAIGPYLQPNLPPDIAARVTFVFLGAAERLAHGVIAWVIAWPGRWLDGLQRARELRRQRRIFERLSDDMLKDIGLTRCDLYGDLTHRRRR